MDVKLWISFDLALFHFDVKTPFVLTLCFEKNILYLNQEDFSCSLC